jgi:hypothetical protein
MVPTAPPTIAPVSPEDDGRAVVDESVPPVVLPPLLMDGDVAA